MLANFKISIFMAKGSDKKQIKDKKEAAKTPKEKKAAKQEKKAAKKD